MLKVLAAAGALSCAIITTGKAETGVASWYGSESGSRTANGERFPTSERTCAHRTARFGSRLHVTDLRTGRAVVCRVNDRGPFIRGRVIDLNPASARALGMSGTAKVRVSPRP
ncbi:hypothetical protein BA190_09275 [Labrys sp. WJW]|uniref:septal ring lytic transglycosylase RlpA family protein n=1 Tax=Labrys sp. WJW TaxID=1737983 RepID=UPI0008314722|nr:septal ring lytic transglycosylase RlpA family protein [Labrys sp. WJW]OCC05096.1 hypothetical protein BA190_09275 [Labrys sp. WJW]